MTTVDLRTPDGATNGTLELDDAVFGAGVNVPAMHQVVVAQLANARRDTAKTRNRTSVRGGGAKPYRQKGTGNARQGSVRAPQYSGGAIAHGRSGVQNHHLRVNKKLKRLALRSALSDRAATGDVLAISEFGIDTPRTKDAVALLERLELADKRVLVVLAEQHDAVRKSFANLQRTVVHTASQLNTYDVLLCDVVLFEQAALEQVTAGGRRDRTEGQTPEATARSATEARTATDAAETTLVQPVVDQTVGETDGETLGETDGETNAETTTQETS